MTKVVGGVTAPLGFRASGVPCGIKRRGKDLALIVSDRKAVAAGTLTRNILKASCVLWAQRRLQSGTARTIVANSGNANCCTGRRGSRDTGWIASRVGESLGISASEVLVAATGVIGRPLPMDRVRIGIAKAVRSLSRTGSHSAAEAILTTDTHPKEIALRWTAGGRAVTIGGIAKGSGMVAPQMATILAFLTTDASIDPRTLQRALTEAVEESFNAITIDAETSTNDMVLILANGAAGAARIRRGGPGYSLFLKSLKAVCRYLAHEIVRDGEGVTRLMAVRVAGARSQPEALKVARRVADSLLVKTMVAGRDPNWGRIAAAVGASGVPVNPNRLILRLGKTVVFRNGEPTQPRHETLLEEVDRPEVAIGIHLHQGSAQAEILGGDLTEGYVRINAKYTT